MFQGKQATNTSHSIADWSDRTKSNPGGGVPSITLCDVDLTPVSGHDGSPGTWHVIVTLLSDMWDTPSSPA